MQYRRLCAGLADKGKLVPSDKLLDNIKDVNKDYYVSIFEYNEEQYQHFKKTNTIAGITDVTTSRLVWDFDQKDNIEEAKQDALELVGRLKEQGLKEDQIIIGFSGNKGFAIEVELTYRLTVKEFKAITAALAKGLSTYDPVVSNASRIVRAFYTKHQKSNLFKVPLTLEQLNSDVETIKEVASSLDNIDPSTEKKSVYIPTAGFLALTKVAPDIEKEVIQVNDITLNNKPKQLTNCRWYLQNGAFGSGERDSALLVLAAYYKNQGFDKDITYRMLKGVAEIQSRRHKSTRFPDNEIWTNIIGQVYGSNWNDGQYSCRAEGSWLHTYCQALGPHKCNHNRVELTVDPETVYGLFKDYAAKYDENILFTGIDDLDKRAKFMVGTSNAFVGPPGIGKTSVVSQILNHNSNANIMSIFFSYDMFHSALYMRLVQRHTGLSQDDIYDIFRKNPKKMQEIANIIKDEYKNVRFCFKAGQTTEEMEETIIDTQEKTGKKVKLAIVDYNELVGAPMADATAASAYVAQRMRQIANEKEVCLITLLQPSKMHSSPGDEVTTFNAAKGSSAIAQSMTTMLGLSRPGFNPRNPETDRYFNITCLKNRNGPLFSLDFSWDGLKGQIGKLSDEEAGELSMLREKRKLEKEDSNGGWNG